MRGARVEVSRAEGEPECAVVGTRGTLPESVADATASQAVAILAVTAPCRLGESLWTVTVPQQELAGCVHEECSCSHSLRVIPHATSLAVWDVPSPVVVDATFTVKVGILCSVPCDLGGQRVEIHDGDGVLVGEHILAPAPWAGTRALYWTDVALRAPAKPEVASRSLTVTLAAAEVPHEPAQIAFSFKTDRPPEHMVAVRVIDRGCAAPVRDVEVRLGSYMTSTDQAGLAEVMVPRGTYELGIRKDGFTAAPIRLDVSRSLEIEVPVTSAPTRAELDERIFDEYPWG
jgi:hypothetical protein